MTDLQGAMQPVDAEERDKFRRDGSAAREDRVGGRRLEDPGSTEPNDERRLEREERARVLRLRRREEDPGDAAEFFFDKANSVRAIARTAVALAADIAGQDARNHRTLDVATTDAVEKLLLNLLAADKADLPPGFKALSSAAAFRKASDVSKALDAEGGQP